MNNDQQEALKSENLEEWGNTWEMFCLEEAQMGCKTFVSPHLTAPV